jgi:energy-coupling factor transport system ATP-binding protein
VREARRYVDGRSSQAPRQNGSRARGQNAVRETDLHVAYGGVPALRGVSLEARRSEVVALMGRNGAGKTTLLRTLVGLVPAERGEAWVLGVDVRERATEELARGVAFVPQEPASVLHKQTVEDEIADVLAGTGRTGTVEDALQEWELGKLRSAHPADLSAGERQRAALAAMLAGRPRLILLDEPTRGMDCETKERLVANLRRRCAEGAVAVVASHDVELAARCADRVILLSDGEIVIQGPAREVLTETLTFSTQVNRLLGGTFLTPEDVLEAPQ